MTITFENDNNVIVYALDKIISFSRNSHYIFLAQCVWWLSSIIALQQSLVTHIDNLKVQGHIGEQGVSTTPKDLQEDIRITITTRKAEDLMPVSYRHPDRIFRVRSSNIKGRDSEPEVLHRVLRFTERIIQKSTTE